MVTKPADAAVGCALNTSVNVGKVNTALPLAHTCFFHVELPDYSTEDRMRWGLSIALHYGAGKGARARKGWTM